MNEEVIDNLKNVHNLIKSLNDLEEPEKNQKFLDNFEAIRVFYDDFSMYSANLQHQKLDDNEQSKLSEMFFYIVKWMVENREKFELTEYYDHIPDTILNKYLDSEMHKAFELPLKKSKDDFYSLKAYMARRYELEEIIRKKDNKSSAESRYINSHDEYLKFYFSHALTFCEHEFMQIPIEDINSLISEVEASGYLDTIIAKENKKLDFNDENLIFQYAMFAMKMKSKFKSDEILDNKVVQALWNGKIKNKEIINILLGDDEKDDLKRTRKINVGNTLDVDYIFRELLKREGYDGHFFKGLADHFDKVGLRDIDIAEIFKNIVSKCGSYSALQFLADLGIPNDIFDFMMNEKVENTSELSFVKHKSSIIDTLKKAEKLVNKGRCYDIPFDYVMKKIPGLTDEAIQNVITLISTGYYKENTEELKTEMIKNGLLKKSGLSDKTIEFQEDDGIEHTKEKIEEAYDNRQVIPYDIATQIIRENYDNHLEISEEVFKACLVSVINHTLSEQGIDIGHRIFFGEHDSTNGSQRSGEFNSIWLNNKLIRNFLNPQGKTDREIMQQKSRVFITAFHEMKHAKQFYNIEKGNIDFLTFNFIKEQVLRNCDDNFYDANYTKMFIEEDARQYGIIDSMKFLKGLGIKDFDKIFPNYKKILEQEVASGNIHKDSDKNHSFRAKTKINNTEYLSLLIRNNPSILEEYNEILKIEFNDDGTQKDVLTMIEEYNTRKNEIEKDENYDQKFKNLYSIYYGLFRQRMARNKNLKEDEKKAIMEFSKISEKLVSVQDLRFYASKTEAIMVKTVLESFEKDLDLIGLDEVADRTIDEAESNVVEPNTTDNKGDDENGEYR